MKIRSKILSTYSDKLYWQIKEEYNSLIFKSLSNKKPLENL